MVFQELFFLSYESKNKNTKVSCKAIQGYQEW